MAAFGSKVSLLVEKRRKLDDRSVEGVFVGYDRDPTHTRFTFGIQMLSRRNVKFDHASTSVLSDPMHEIVIVNRYDQVDNIFKVKMRLKTILSKILKNNENDENSIVDRPSRNVKMPKYLSDKYVVDCDTDDSNDSDSSDVCYRMYTKDTKEL